MLTSSRNKILAVITMISLASCKKFVDIEGPPNVVISDQVFTSDEKAKSALMGVYANMINNGSQFSNWSITAFAGLSSDELVKFNASVSELEFLSNQLSATNPEVQNVWQSIYKNIHLANLVLEGAEKSTQLSASVRQQLIGESKFIRAFCHFYAANLYGDAPLVATSNYAVTADLGRSSVAAIYQQIVLDLKDAKNLLNTAYPVANPVTNTKTRPNKWAATALLARVYLYLKDWQKAEAESSEVIGSGSYTPMPILKEVFSKNSIEAIWQLGQTTPDIREFSNAFQPAGGTPKYYLTTSVMNSFEAGDQRRSAWVDSVTVATNKYYYPGKYKINAPLNPPQFYMVLRIAEQFLIRAEARANQNNLNGAISDLNVIRARASLGSLSATLDQAAILSAVEKERKTEFFAEWGNRWLDLKRTNRADAVLIPLKSPNWTITDLLWPIPINEIIANASLTQNPGY